jgi:hypothetical protein
LRVVDSGNQGDPTYDIPEKSRSQIGAEYRAPGNFPNRGEKKGLNRTRHYMAEMAQANEVTQDDDDPEPGAFGKRQQPNHERNEPAGEDATNEMGNETTLQGLAANAGKLVANILVKREIRVHRPGDRNAPEQVCEQNNCP